MTETIDNRLGTLASSLTDGAAQAIHSIELAPYLAHVFADRRHRAGDPVDQLPPDPPHLFADGGRHASDPFDQFSPRPSHVVADLRHRPGDRSRRPAHRQRDRDHRRPQRPPDRHHHRAVPGNPSGHRNPGRRGRHRYRYARRAVRGPAGFARRSRGRPHREQRTAGQRRPDGPRRGIVARDQVPCRGCGALADQPCRQYQRDHPDRRPRRAAVAAFGFLRRRRAVEADLGGSRARPHRRRHRCRELDPDQRPRCAGDPCIGLPEAASQVKSLSADVERTLSAAGSATAGSIVAGAREAQTTLVTASADAANQVKSLAADVERTLSAAGNATAARSSPARAKSRPRWSPLRRRPPTTSSRWRPMSNGRCRSPGLPPPNRSSAVRARPRPPSSPPRRMPPITSSRWRPTSSAR